MHKERKILPIIFLAILGLSFLTALGLVAKRTILERQEFGGEGKVAVLEIEGVLMESTKAVKQLAALAERDDIGAVVLRIDSPGGAVGPSQEIFEQVLRLKKEKKVVVSMGDLAASGGYYIACAADRIVANPGTITGSIGVLMQFLNIKELAAKLHIKEITIKSGKNKDLGNPFGELTAEQRQILQEVSDDVHLQFIEAVAKGRKIPVKEVAKIADGRIFSGRQALRLKLVDELGNLEKAIEVAGKLAGLAEKPQVTWIKEKRSFWRELLAEDPEEAIFGLLFRLWGKIGFGARYLLDIGGER